MVEENETKLDRAMPMALAPIEAVEVKAKLANIKAFQAICRQELVEGLDYGVIPGTQRPTLLKPGAEKIIKLLGLAESYEEMATVEDWERGFFYYKMRCRLTDIRTGLLITSGLGSCNSKEARYRWRWLWPREAKDAGVDLEKAVTRTAKTRTGNVYQYRVENDDPFSLVNTLIKMAKKRAQVDAALSAGRLSDIFTQDLEDMQAAERQEETPTPTVVEPTEKPTVTPRTPAETPPAEKPTSGGGVGATSVPERPTLKNLGDLYNAARKHFAIDKHEVLRLLGMQEVDIVDLDNAWDTLMAHRGP